MTNPSEDFVTNFHSISGETLAERRRNFRVLLNKTQKSLKDESQDIDLSSLHPTSSFEEILKVEAIIYFRKVPELLKILKGENPVHIAKVLKVSSIFLAEAFQNVNGEELTKDIFPFLSFNTKLKLLTKLAMYLENVQQVEEFFEALSKSYGLYMAAKILHGCSDNFILKTIKANRIEVTPGQLMIIIKKYPEATESILELLDDTNNKLSIAEKYKVVFIHLMHKNTSLFIKLNEKYKPTFCIGHRMTQTFISKNKQTVVKDSEKIYKLLKQEQVFRSLKHDFKEFYFNLFPKTLSECLEQYDELLALLEHTPFDWPKGNLIQDIFKNKLGSELCDYPKFVTLKLIEMMSPDEREIWMTAHSKPKEILEEDWISCMKTDKSLPLLKERISFTSNIKGRAKLAGYLVTTCKINRDKVALLDVCNYMITKHQNDHYSVRQTFLRSVRDTFGLNKLEKDHWKHVNELIHLSSFNNEAFYDNSAFSKLYIKFCLDNNLPAKEQLKEWIKYNYCQLTFDNPKYEMKCLPLFGSMVALGRKEDELRYAHVSYLSTLSLWNEAHPKHQISLLPYKTSLDYFKSTLKEGKEPWFTEMILLQLIKTNIEEEEKCTMLNDFFACDCSYINGALLKWLLKNKPGYIRDNIELITKAILRIGRMQKLPTMWIQLKLYEHLGIPQKMCEICVKVLEIKHEDIEDGNKTIELGVAIKGLSNLMKPMDFINLISPHYPSTLTVEIKSQDDQWKTKIQKSIAASIRNIVPPSHALESVLKFSKGDYLLFIQKSLYLVSSNVAENKLPPFLNELSTRAVSTRKHSIYLMIKTLPKPQICEIFEKMVKTEKNSSIRKSLFKAAFNFLINYPDDYSWELLKEIVLLLDIKDNEAFKILTKWQRIPRNYIQPYILFTWGILNKLPSSKELEEKQCQIFEAITASIIPSLSKDFCTQIIEKYLFQSNQSDAFQTRIQTFSSRCIIYSKSLLQQQEYLKVVFTLLEKFVTVSWCDPKSCKDGRITVFNFVSNFCSDFLEKKCSSIEIFNQFKKSWNELLKPHEALTIHLYLEFTLIFLKSSNLIETAEQLLMLFESELKLNGAVIIDSFEKITKLFLKPFLLSETVDVAEENRYIVIENIMKNDSSANRFMLTMFFLPDDIPSILKLKCKHESIMQELMSEKEPFIQIYLDKYLQKSQDHSLIIPVI